MSARAVLVLIIRSHGTVPLYVVVSVLHLGYYRENVLMGSTRTNDRDQSCYSLLIFIAKQVQKLFKKASVVIRVLRRATKDLGVRVRGLETGVLTVVIIAFAIGTAKHCQPHDNRRSKTSRQHD
jgi:hypothetical protein